MSANPERSPDATQQFAASGDLSASPNLSASSSNNSPAPSDDISRDRLPASSDDAHAHPDNIPAPPDSEDARACSATQETEKSLTLASLPVGARLVLRCRRDWRDATVAAVALDCIVLSVGSPSGRTYRVRRAPDSPLSLDGAIHVLGDSGAWRVSLARYDTRW